MRGGRVFLAWLLGGLALVLQPIAAVAASASSLAELLAEAAAAAPLVASPGALRPAGVPAMGYLVRVVQLEAGGVVVFSLVEGKLVSRYYRGQRVERK